MTKIWILFREQLPEDSKLESPTESGQELLRSTHTYRRDVWSVVIVSDYWNGFNEI